MLEKLLDGTASPKLKERALFVLAQSNSPRAREVLKNIAKGNSTPELQSRAIEYLGVHGGTREPRGAGRDLRVDDRRRREAPDPARVHGRRARRIALLTAAQSEQNPELRGEAVQQLGVMGAHEELWQLYQKETAVDVKKQIIRAMFTGGNVTRMIELAKTEQNPELRRTAVRNLGIMGSKRTGDALVEIYNSDKDAAITQDGHPGAVPTRTTPPRSSRWRARKQDPAMKKDIVQKLSIMDSSKVATDYMIELLNGK